MPYVNIKVTKEGVTREQKERLVSETTEMLRVVLNKNPATTFVIIEEVETDNWSIAGELVTDIRARNRSGNRTKSNTGEQQ